MSTIQLDIVTPERVVYSEEVEMVVVPAMDGDLGILPKHAPLISGLNVGKIRFKNQGNETVVVTSGGFLEVKPDQVNVLADTAEFPDEIDIERAREAKQRAEKRLEQNSPDVNEIRAENALKRAINRMKVAKGE
ncbi:ATP synthase F1 subcomplex epsilon subunit [Selenihalanaerobacter shriftii]|uniref:ATP synthase epsilon chain n=2 Tax=Selenihalanaerobacter shriftii TaxID=142842 RepID=A0A1T4KZS6_9FIRM|nr:F0F1 ATP synthase subunit epsilon [Selenihalanaerobacter shriftii]SJZ47972.1 ATP synthase F1 subcomplex epsilon subunit [Selenihalanaerobacter shriftii]